MKRSLSPWLLLLASLLLLFASACSSASTSSADTESSAPAQQPETTEATSQAAVVGAAAVELVASFEFLDEVSVRMAATPYRSETFFPEAAMEEMEFDGPMSSGASDGTWAMVALAGSPTEEGGFPSVDEPSAIMISDGVDVYMYSPQLSMFPPEVLDPVSRAAVEGWVLLRAAEIEALVGADSAPSMNPPAFLTADDWWANLREASSITEGPRSTIRGVETRSILVEIEQTAIFAESPTTTVAIHIDAQGYVRSIIEDVGRVDFFDFGDDGIRVEPPADATDMTEAWLERVEAQQTQPGPSMSTQDLAAAAELVAELEAADAAPVPAESGHPTVLQFLRGQPEASVFLELLEFSDSVDIFPNERWTVVVPTNDALESMGDELDAIRSDPALRNRFVRRHLIAGAFDVAALLDEGSVVSMEIEAISISGEGNDMVLNGDVSILIPAVPTASGFVYVTGRPL